MDWTIGMVEYWNGGLGNLLFLLSLFIMLYLLGCHYSLDWTTGLEYWTGLLDWNTGLSYFPFLDKFLYLFIERRLN